MTQESRCRIKKQFPLYLRAAEYSECSNSPSSKFVVLVGAIIMAFRGHFPADSSNRSLMQNAPRHRLGQRQPNPALQEIPKHLSRQTIYPRGETIPI